MNDAENVVGEESKVTLPKLKATKIVFDWDDTFMATTWLDGIKRAPNQEELVDLEILSKLVIAIITQAKLYGDVIIVTNADQGWVQYSCSEYMSSLLPHLLDMPIISAQERYSSLYSNPTFWKFAAFRDEILEGVLPYSWLNVVSIGDSDAEFKAVNCLKNIIPSDFNINLITKGIKLMEKPTIKLLIQQLQILNRDIKSIIECPQSINQRMASSDMVEKLDSVANGI